jgi:NAD(P)-dependent dehydrogenase (short-subunit alcohol dehydrogenase family)
MSQLDRPAVFVTGAAAGIGAAAARLLAAEGFAVFAGVHKTLVSWTRYGACSWCPSTSPTRTVWRRRPNSWPRVGTEGLAAVINNAGLIVQGPLELISPDQLRLQFEVNTLGPAYVTQAFLPLLRTGSGRVINISAPTARVPMPFMAPISASKAALSAISDATRLELAAWKIPVVVIEPGGTQTEIFAKAEARAHEDLTLADPARVALYRTQLAAVAKAGARQKLGAVDPVAATIVKAVTARRPKRRYTAGRGVAMFGLLARLPAGARERLIAIALGVGRAAPAATV